MRKLVLLPKVVLVTGIACVGAWWAVGSINLSGIYPSSWTEAQLIRHRCRVRLVQPEWVSANPDALMDWMIAETKARLGAVAVLWAVGIGFVIVTGTRENQHESEK
jgi:hypothetical protein